MTKDEIIRMAREAGFHALYTQPEEHPDHVAIIERFAALVADAEAKRIYDEGMVTVGHMREKIAAEREACAKVCDDSTELLNRLGNYVGADETNACAAAIRARKP